MALAGLAAETSRVRIGVLVTSNTYRHPGLLAKMGATLDHTSGGRLILGLGAGWFEREHQAYGIPFYTTGERIRRLDEAAAIIGRLWTEMPVTFEGRYYRLKDAYCEPKPVQRPRPPVMIGGGGERLTLAVVARHADQWNTFGSPEVFRHKLTRLREHCVAAGRDLGAIEISWTGLATITDSRAERDGALQRVARAFGRPVDEVEAGALIGPVAEVRERVGRFLDVGVTHFILGASAPFDHASLRRFAEEVMPAFRG
jgi:F420-dependent oxidoreductase-like protein